MNLKNSVVNAFQHSFDCDPAWLARSPGRVNLIGEHTDYNEGFVLPMAINRAAIIAFSKRADRRVILHSQDFQNSLDFDLSNLRREPSGWGEYIKGVAWAYQQEGVELCGWQGVVAGDVPIGAGLSSSAALELAAARVFTFSAGFEWQPVKAAELSQKAERQWVGTQCGIMDQLISAAGQDGSALWIDCRSLAFEAVPLPESMLVVILDTATRRGLVGSKYNERRQQCEQAAATMGVKALRDLQMDELIEKKNRLDALLFRRAQHVVSENLRVMQSVEALRQGDPQRFGQLVSQSHASLRDDFEVSCKELDCMTEIAQSQPGCYGARMTGGGFGGCAMALVEQNHVEVFVQRVAEQYRVSTGLQPEIYVTGAHAGTSLEKL